MSSLVAAASPHVTQWPQRLLLTAVVLVVVVLAVLGMWRGGATGSGDRPTWRTGRCAVGPGRPLARADGRYVGTVRSGDWLDRVVAGGLGPVGPAALEVSAVGVLLERAGQVPLFIPRATWSR